MMKKFPILLIILLLASLHNLSAQKIKGKKNLIAELQKTESAIDKEAEAEFIYARSNSYLSNTMQIKIEAQIKIFDKDKAAAWGTLAYHHHKNDDVQSFKATLHYLEDGKLITKKYDKKAIITEVVNDRISSLIFTYPQLSDGCIISYEFTLNSDSYFSFGPWYFQHTIPTRYSEFKTILPSFFKYNIDFSGFETVDEQKETVGYRSTPYGQIACKTSLYVLKDVPAIKDEAFVMNVDDYRSAISYELASTMIPGEPIQTYSSNWRELALKLMDAKDFGFRLTNNNSAKKIYKELQSKLANKDLKQQLAIIQEGLCERVKWNNYYSYSSYDASYDVLKDKEGNSGEINLLLVAILKEAGIKADPLVLSTVNNGKLNYYSPSLMHLNYVIAMATDDRGKSYFIDATDKFNGINALPLRCMNDFGILIEENNFQKIALCKNARIYSNIDIACTLNADNELEGNYTRKEYGYKTIEKRNALEESKKDFTSDLRSTYESIEIDSIHFENAEESEAPFISQFQFIDPNNVMNLGGKLAISPMLFLKHLENPFKKEKRKYPIEIGGRTTSTVKIQLNIPDDYTVETLPTSKKMSLPDRLGSFSLSYTQKGNTLLVSRSLKMNKAYYSVEEAKGIKELYLKFIEAQEEMIVLVKKSEVTTTATAVE